MVHAGADDGPGSARGAITKWQAGRRSAGVPPRARGDCEARLGGYACTWEIGDSRTATREEAIQFHIIQPHVV